MAFCKPGTDSIKEGAQIQCGIVLDTPFRLIRKETQIIESYYLYLMGPEGVDALWNALDRLRHVLVFMRLSQIFNVRSRDHRSEQAWGAAASPFANINNGCAIQQAQRTVLRCCK
jgi:hypothetical protein